MFVGGNVFILRRKTEFRELISQPGHMPYESKYEILKLCPSIFFLEELKLNEKAERLEEPKDEKTVQ